MHAHDGATKSAEGSMTVREGFALHMLFMGLKDGPIKEAREVYLRACEEALAAKE